MLQSESQDIGFAAEELAKKFLIQQGLQCVTANYQCKVGEIDLIMQDGETLVFVEVRYRKSQDYGDPIATITKGKQRKIIAAAKTYLLANNLYDQVACRFDVVAINHDQFEWIQDAFWVRWR